MSKRNEQQYDWFYRKKDWLNLRAIALDRDNYLCRRCVRLGKIRPKPAVIVHHIIPITKDFNKALKLDNLESLCLECHNKVHPEKAANRLSKDGFFGAPGMGNNLTVKVRYRLGSRNC